jgi:hypothetical protein
LFEANPTADIRFISDLIDHLEKHFNSDPSRISATDFNGGRKWRMPFLRSARTIAR